jgi:hypothetical protein
MSTTRLVVLILSATCVCGCHDKRPAPLPPPATAFTAERLQAEFQEEDPSAKVGLVDAVTPQDQLVAVSHLDVADFHAGDPISFMDTNKDLIGDGTVVRTVDDLLIVRYAHTKRMLREGDLAVRVKL